MYVAHEKISCAHSDLVNFPKPIIYFCVIYRLFFFILSVQFARVLQVLLHGASWRVEYSVHSVYERLAQLQSGLGKPCV